MMGNHRIDQSANLIIDHEEVVSGLPEGVGFIHALEFLIDLETEDYHFHPLLIEGIKCLKIAEDTWLLWWNRLFIGQYTANYFMDDGTGCIECIDDAFWNDFVVSDEENLFNDNENYGDMKIRAELHFVAFLNKHPDHYTWYNDRYVRPEGYVR